MHIQNQKTKIVATIGPASANEEVLSGMIKAGLDIVRLNFAHGSFSEHEPKVRLTRELSQRFNQPVAIMQDLVGTKYHSELPPGALTEKDKADLEFAFAHDLELISFSFVRWAEDVRALKDFLKAHRSRVEVIAKIETKEAVQNFDVILAEADGIMVARGDLALQIPAEDVPLVQKMIIKKCNQAGKFVIVATQMLESMVHSPEPTRAEVSDIANAILDGADAIMLSEETTLGEHPVEVVKVMARVAARVERDRSYTHQEHN